MSLHLQKLKGSCCIFIIILLYVTLIFSCIEAIISRTMDKCSISIGKKINMSMETWLLVDACCRIVLFTPLLWHVIFSYLKMHQKKNKKYKLIIVILYIYTILSISWGLLGVIMVQKLYDCKQKNNTLWTIQLISSIMRLCIM